MLLKFERKSCYFFFILKSKSFQFFCKATHGPSAQASYLTSQGVIEEMFQDIITNGTDVETAAKAAEDKLNDIFDTMIS